VGNSSSVQNVLPQSYSVQIDVLLESSSVFRADKNEDISTRPTNAAYNFSDFIFFNYILQEDSVSILDDILPSGTISE
jgi:hypothetical protein